MSRKRVALALAIVTPLGFATKLSDLALLHGWASGVLYVVFWIYVALLVQPRWDPVRVALWVFCVTCTLELLQLWHPPFLQTIRTTFVGHTLIGATFAWWDFVGYAVGAAAAAASAPLLRA